MRIVPGLAASLAASIDFPAAILPQTICSVALPRLAVSSIGRLLAQTALL